MDNKNSNETTLILKRFTQLPKLNSYLHTFTIYIFFKQEFRLIRW